jgi:salicylate hydroxylase
MLPSSTTDRTRVAVVGAGIAGLSVAAFLARAGITATVYEQATELGEVGAGLQLSPNGSRLLHRAGLGAHLSAAAIRPEAIEVRRWQDNGLIARTELGAACEAAYGAPYYTVHRAKLHSGLLGLVEDRVRRGRRCVAVTEYADRVELRFAGGATVAADLVVGADGLHSVVRRAVSADVARFSGLTVHRGLVRDTAGEPLVRIWLGPQRHVVCYPIGNGVANVVDAGRPESFTGWHDEVHAIVARADSWTRWPLYEREPLARWSTRRIVLAGDAAHPLLPFGAQGANQAIEDAAALAACLGRGGLADLPTALARYERARVPRVDRVRAMVRANADDHHLPDGAGQRRRDVPMRARESLHARAWLFGYDAEVG